MSMSCRRRRHRCVSRALAARDTFDQVPRRPARPPLYEPAALMVPRKWWTSDHEWWRRNWIVRSPAGRGNVGDREGGAWWSKASGRCPMSRRCARLSSILREQAIALMEQTNGLLVGQVETNQQPDGNLLIQLGVTVPALNQIPRLYSPNYQQPIALYPGRLSGMGIPGFEDIYSEEDFVTVVKRVLAAQEIKNVLTSLMSQVGGPCAQPVDRRDQGRRTCHRSDPSVAAPR